MGADVSQKIVYICDRCGAEITRPHANMQINGISVEQNKDLCEKCFKALRDFLRNV